MKRHSCIICGILLLSVAGCGKPAEAPKETAPAGSAHPETAVVEAAGAVGYDEKSLRGKVDAVIDRNAERNRQMEDALKPQGQGGETP